MMSRFNSGQKLVCINREGWADVSTDKDSKGPAFNEEVTFLKAGNAGYIVLVEYEKTNVPLWLRLLGEVHQYDASQFEPLISDEILEAELKEIPEMNLTPKNNGKHF